MNKPAGCAEPQPIYSWPRVRERRDGAYSITGWCFTVPGWVRTIVLCRIIALVLAWYLLALAVLPIAVTPTRNQPAYEPGDLSAFMVHVLHVRQQWAILLLEHYPAVGRAVGFQVFPIDPYLLVLTMVSWFQAWRVATLLAYLAAFLFWPLLLTRVRVTVAPHRIIVHRWFWRTVIPRDDNSQNPPTFKLDYPERCMRWLRYLAGTPLRYLLPRLPEAPASAALLHGLRRYPFLIAWRKEVAEQFVVACVYAKDRSTAHLPALRPNESASSAAGQHSVKAAALQPTW